MSKNAKTAGNSLKAGRKDWPLVIYIWMIGLGLAGYFIGRVALDSQPHPYHWAAGLLGAGIGFCVGWLWYWWRGDI